MLGGSRAITTAVISRIAKLITPSKGLGLRGGFRAASNLRS